MQTLTEFSHRIDDANVLDIVARLQYSGDDIRPDKSGHALVRAHGDKMMPFPVPISYSNLFLADEVEMIYLQKFGDRKFNEIPVLPNVFPYLPPGGFPL